MGAFAPPQAATPADAPAVGRLLARSYATLMAGAYALDTLAAALPLITRAQPDLLESGRYAVIGGPDTVIACGGWSVERPGSGQTEPGIGHIRHFAVDPEYLGAGHGRSLYAWCERGARAEGVDAFLCYASLNAEGFYGALGFERLDAVDVSIAGTVAFPAILMRKPL